jgi:hypothetical protein
MGNVTKANTVLARKVERKISLGRLSCRWEVNIEIGDKYVVDWIELVKDVVQWQAEHINDLSQSIRGEDCLTT